MNEKQCAICLYWQRDGIDGICRIHAPKPEIMVAEEGKDFTLVWPRTNPNDWCGDGVMRESDES